MHINEKIILDIQNKIATITLNRPEKGNALNDELIQQLNSALDDTKIKDARVLVIKANGKNFSTGADIEWLRKIHTHSAEDNLQDMQALANLLQKLYLFNIPTVAIIQGKTFGGGLGIIACADIAICEENASFCFSEAKIGLIPAVISPFIVKAIGKRWAKSLFLSAEVFSAKKAQQIGLITHTVNANELDSFGYHLASQVLTCSPKALEAAKKLLLNDTFDNIDKMLLQNLSSILTELCNSPEGQEGITAFLAKRKPAWDLTQI